MRTTATVSFIAVCWASLVVSEEAHTPYSGLENRAIAALSESDIDALEAGQGWGFALPAELNGYPGPLHTLELAEALALSPEQEERLTEIFEQMPTDAKAAGAAFISAEAALDRAFSQGGITQETLSDAVFTAGNARSALRLVHLSRHLMTVEILNEAQIQRYNVLRGYADDPCAATPDGHDPAMWRRHNGCEG
ncbi:hypothetical protein [Sulfitobacter aestuariivivens]|uniref:Uncharacterized protein n=1 Tax=Sulfitobacter aestuariivivens TaxID=2766981 RepID=A0A927D5C6_9RHOB|nr:hypothetical protein [Sulfitobacter aestuariivivens]MBD3665433.1 hypothetical protein [Sulfitobacter aestuariivivens]